MVVSDESQNLSLTNCPAASDDSECRVKKEHLQRRHQPAASEPGATNAAAQPRADDFAPSAQPVFEHDSVSSASPSFCSDSESSLIDLSGCSDDDSAAAEPCERVEPAYVTVPPASTASLKRKHTSDPESANPATFTAAATVANSSPKRAKRVAAPCSAGTALGHSHLATAIVAGIGGDATAFATASISGLQLEATFAVLSAEVMAAASEISSSGWQMGQMLAMSLQS